MLNKTEVLLGRSFDNQSKDLKISALESNYFLQGILKTWHSAYGVGHTFCSSVVVRRRRY
jgi:hypothetical protein